MNAFISVYVTVASRDEAEKIAHSIVGEGLAACANIVPQIHSIYRWQGKVETADECAMILKASAAGFEDLKKRIKSLHSYHLPCIVAWPIVQGDETYLAWIGENS